VTYGSAVKWDTLVDRYSVNPEDIAVVPHACWNLRPWIEVSGFPDATRSTKLFCESVLQGAVFRTYKNDARQRLQSGSIRFLFYASQFRPNKNVVTLLRAYEHLLRERFVQIKLILTGDPNRDPAVFDYVRDRGLGNDVLFLHGMTTRELAACYYLADLAVNPSMSEGGCPFTFTEALSVDTPVVMARIQVTQEALGDPSLREMMLFDPHDYLDASMRIEWALQNRGTLLEKQKEAYAHLRKRTWSDVVDEYLTILENLASSAPRGPGRD